MHLTELFETYKDLVSVKLTLRSDPETPGALRLLDTNTRQLIGLVRSVRDFDHLMHRKNLHGGSFEIVIPPQVYADNQQLVDSLVRFRDALMRTHGRSITMKLASGQELE